MRTKSPAYRAPSEVLLDLAPTETFLVWHDDAYRSDNENEEDVRMDEESISVPVQAVYDNMSSPTSSSQMNIQSSPSSDDEENHFQQQLDSPDSSSEIEADGVDGVKPKRIVWRRDRCRGGNPELARVNAARQFIEVCCFISGYNSRHIPTQKQIQKAGMDTKWQQVGRNYLKENQIVMIDTKTRLTPSFSSLGDVARYLDSIAMGLAGDDSKQSS